MKFESNVKELKAKEKYNVHYKVPEKYSNDLDMFIEDVIGNDGTACLTDSEQKNDTRVIVGYVTLEFPEGYEYNPEYINEIAKQFNLLAEGKLFDRVN